MTKRTDVFEETAVLGVQLKQGPTGTSEFNFCPTPAADAKLNLTNAAWLAFMAANEYSHFHYFGAVMNELGFAGTSGESGGGDEGFDWKECSIDLRLMRGFEKTHATAIKKAHRDGTLVEFLKPHASSEGVDGANDDGRWGVCAQRWFEASGYDGKNYPAPSFEKYLVQTTHPGHNLQFFSGGEFVLEGKAFVEGSTQVFFARHKTLPVLIVSFRGTEPNKWHDIAADGKAWKTKLTKHGWPDGWGSVHSGFQAAFESIGPLMREKLKEYEGSGVGIWITGHSLGGALATMMAADVFRRQKTGEDFDLRGVYTFGSPRVGNNAFHKQFSGAAMQSKTRVVRFRNGDDTVTAIPGIIEYKHVGTLAHLGEGTLKFPKGDPDYAGIGAVGDHNMTGWGPKGKSTSGYYRRIRELLDTDLGSGDLNQCP